MPPAAERNQRICIPVVYTHQGSRSQVEPHRCESTVYLQQFSEKGEDTRKVITSWKEKRSVRTLFAAASWDKKCLVSGDRTKRLSARGHRAFRTGEKARDAHDGFIWRKPFAGTLEIPRSHRSSVPERIDDSRGFLKRFREMRGYTNTPKCRRGREKERAPGFQDTENRCEGSVLSFREPLWPPFIHPQSISEWVRIILWYRGYWEILELCTELRRSALSLIPVRRKRFVSRNKCELITAREISWAYKVQTLNKSH